MDIEPTQAIPLSDYESGDETDEEAADTERLPVAHLKVLVQKGHPEKEFPIYEGLNMIGRSPTCNVHIDLRALSKEHALIEVRGGEHFIVDKGSKNKTRRNKAYLRKDVQYELRGGEELMFADVQCLYIVQPHTKEASTAEEKQESFIYEADDSDQDVLQPTQAYAKEKNSKKERVKSYAATQLYVADSDTDLDSPALQIKKGAHRKKHMVLETPAANKPKQTGHNDYVIPDSDPDESSPEISSTTRKPPPRVSLALTETLCYDTDNESEEDNKTVVQNKNSANQKKLLSLAATQAYIPDSSDEESMSAKPAMAATSGETQAYVMDTEDPDNAAILLRQHRHKVSPKPLSAKPAVAATSGETQAYVMDTEDPDNAAILLRQHRHKVSPKKTRSPRQVLGTGATQAYDMDVEDSASGGQGEKVSERTSKEAEGATQTFHDGADSDKTEGSPVKSALNLGGSTMAYDFDSSDEESLLLPVQNPGAAMLKSDTDSDDDEAGTQEFGDTVVFSKGKENDAEASTQQFAADETVAVATSTSSSKRAPAKREDSGDETDDGEAATQQLDAGDTLGLSNSANKPGNQHNTGDVDDGDAATQQLDAGDTLVLPGHQRSASDVEESEAPTQTFSKAETVVVSHDEATQELHTDEEGYKSNADSDATQIFEDTQTPVLQVRNKTKTTKPIAAMTDETQLFEDQDTPVLSIRNTRTANSKPVNCGDETQIFEDQKTSVLHVKRSRNSYILKPVSAVDETQIFDDAATPILSVGNTLSSKGKPTNAADETQIFDDARTPILSIRNQTSNTHSINNAADETQIFDDARTPTLPVRNQRSNKPPAVNSADETQIFANNAGDDTQLFDATQLVEGGTSDTPVLYVRDKERAEATSGVSLADATQLFPDESQTPVLTVRAAQNSQTESQTPVLLVSKHTKGSSARKPSLRRNEGSTGFDPTRQNLDNTMPIEDQPTQLFDAPEEADTEPISDADTTTDMETQPITDEYEKNETQPLESSNKSQPITDEDQTQSTEADDVPYQATEADEETESQVLVKSKVIEIIDNLGNSQQTQGMDPDGFAIPGIPAGLTTSKIKSPGKHLNSDDMETQAYGDDDVIDAKNRTNTDDLETQAYDGFGSPQKPLNTDDLATQAYSELIPKTTPKKSTATKSRPPADSEQEADEYSPIFTDDLCTQSYGDTPSKRRKRDSGSLGSNPPKLALELSLNTSSVRSESPAKSAMGVVESSQQEQDERPVSMVPLITLQAATPGPAHQRKATHQKDKVTFDVKEEDETTVKPPSKTARAIAAASAKSRQIRGKATNKTTAKKAKEMKNKLAVINAELRESDEDIDPSTILSNTSDKNDGKQIEEDETSTKGNATIEQDAEIEAPTKRGGRGRGLARKQVEKSKPGRKISPRNATEDHSIDEIDGNQTEKIETNTKINLDIEQAAEVEAPSKRGGRGRGWLRKQPANTKPGRKTSPKDAAKDKHSIASDAETISRSRSTTPDISEVLATNNQKSDSTSKQETTLEVPSRPRRGRSASPKNEEPPPEPPTGRRGRGRKATKKEHPVEVDQPKHDDANTEPITVPEVADEPKEKDENSEISEEISPETTVKGRRGRKATGRASTIKQTPANTEQTIDKPKSSTRGSRNTLKHDTVVEVRIKQENVEDNTTEVTSHVIPIEQKPVKRRGRRATLAKKEEPVVTEPSKSVPGTSQEEEIPEETDESQEPKGRGKGRFQSRKGARKAPSNATTEEKTNEELTEDNAKPKRSQSRRKVDEKPESKPEVIIKEEIEDDEETQEVKLEEQPATSRGRGRKRTKQDIELDKDKNDTHDPPKKAKRGTSKIFVKEEITQEEPVESVETQSAPRGRRGRKSTKNEEQAPPSQESSASMTSQESLPPPATRGGRGRKAASKSKVRESSTESECSQKGRVTKRTNQRAAKQNADEPVAKKGRQAAASETPKPEEDTPPSTPVRGKGRGKATKAKGSPRTPRNSGSTSTSQSDVTDTPHTPTLRHRSETKPKVMFTGVVDAKGEKIIKSLGGEIAESIEDCTHLVTDKVRRTMKFLCGVARGIYIVQPVWLERCHQATKFVDATPYIIDDKQAEKNYGFNLNKSLARAREDGGMFTDWRIHVTKGVLPGPDVMKDIITYGGGHFLSAMPKKASDKLVVVSCADDVTQCVAAQTAGIPVVSAEFILTGVLRQVLDVNAYRLNLPKGAASGKRKK